MQTSIFLTARLLRKAHSRARPNILRALPCVFLLGLLDTSFAYDAARHPVYANQAVIAFRGCGYTLPASAAAALAAGTQDEDTAPLNLYDRSTNWHFYNREGRLRPWAFGNRSLDRIFAKRSQALEIALRGESNINDVYHRAGQVLHYIQDMSVPAHVAPAFHMKLPLWDRSDPFDNFTAPVDSAPFALTSKQCSELSDQITTDPVTATRLLANAAKRTLSAISPSVLEGQTSDTDWRAYWIYPSDNHADAANGWGAYGLCVFARRPQRSGCKTPRQEEALFALQYQRTVTDSIRILIYLDKRRAKHPTTAFPPQQSLAGQH
ncbi:hypothetical protein [Pseudomonas sp. CFBP 13710]|uniref:hypothetical protein n=1 Tax=Pseudomonas sp. CFBP 13710 TaxID=2775311 RepID=UPI001784E3CD|nr:hypothetical protein [Pseudomonas sp. CFBP 13710]MBD8733033.1 hypothetical protein [Pseudomonas sp. CFBP 13710]